MYKTVVDANVNNDISSFLRVTLKFSVSFFILTLNYHWFFQIRNTTNLLKKEAGVQNFLNFDMYQNSTILQMKIHFSFVWWCQGLIEPSLWWMYTQESFSWTHISKNLQKFLRRNHDPRALWYARIITLRTCLGLPVKQQTQTHTSITITMINCITIYTMIFLAHALHEYAIAILFNLRVPIHAVWNIHFEHRENSYKLHLNMILIGMVQ